eukprot:g24540.t1
MEDLWLLKVAAGVTLLGVALIGGLLPLYLERAEVSKECLSGRGRVWSVGCLEAEDEPFPLASTLAGIMFLALMMVEAHAQQACCSVDPEERPDANPCRCCEGDSIKNPFSNKASPLLKGHEPDSPTTAARQRISARVMVLALAVHSLLEGISIGVLNRASTFVSIFLAVSAHKGLAGFAMSSKLMHSVDGSGFGGLGARATRAGEKGKERRKTLWTDVRSIQLKVAKLKPGPPFGSWKLREGILLGCSMVSFVAGVGIGCLISLAAGTFLYIAIPELLLPAVQHSTNWRSCRGHCSFQRRASLPCPSWPCGAERGRCECCTNGWKWSSNGQMPQHVRLHCNLKNIVQSTMFLQDQSRNLSTFWSQYALLARGRTLARTESLWARGSIEMYTPDDLCHCSPLGHWCASLLELAHRFAGPGEDDKCPPKILLIDIPSGDIIDSYVFPDEVAPYTGSFLNDIVLDVEHQMAYISSTEKPVCDANFGVIGSSTVHLPCQAYPTVVDATAPKRRWLPSFDSHFGGVLDVQQAPDAKTVALKLTK